MPEAIMQGAGCLPGDGGHEWAPSLAQNRWTARFKDRPTDRPTACSTEHEYQMWHGEQQIPLLRVGFLVGFVIVTVQLIFGTSDPNTMVGRLSVAYPEQAWMAKGVGACARICIGIGGLLLISRRVRSALVSRRLVQAYTVVVLCTCGTLDLVAVYWLASWSGEQERSRWASELAPPPPADVERPDYDYEHTVTMATRCAYFHATTISCYAALIGGLAGLRPEYALFVAILLTVLSHMQFEAAFAWSLLREGVLQPENVVPYHVRAFPLLAMLLLAVSVDRSGRREFRAQKLLQHSNAERIEQLKREKERCEPEPTRPPACPPTRLPASMHACTPACLPACLPASLPAYRASIAVRRGAVSGRARVCAAPAAIDVHACRHLPPRVRALAGSAGTFGSRCRRAPPGVWPAARARGLSARPQPRGVEWRSNSRRMRTRPLPPRARTAGQASSRSRRGTPPPAVHVAETTRPRYPPRSRPSFRPMLVSGRTCQGRSVQPPVAFRRNRRRRPPLSPHPAQNRSVHV